MSFPSSASPTRRDWLRGAALAGCASLAPLAQAQLVLSPPGPANRSGRLRMVQLLDMSAEQQELSRDYSTGVRLAWAVESARGRVLSRIALQTINTDGTTDSVRDALNSLQQDPGVIGLVGTVGDRLAVQVQTEMRSRNLRLAHVAPWMADSRFEADDSVACLFASRATQLQQALSAMHGMGVNELCVIYASAAEQALYDPQVAAMALAQKLRLSRLAAGPSQPLTAVASRIPASSAMVLCLATSAELAQLTQAMAKLKDRRFVLGLGDVDAPTLMQLAPGKGVPVILTQVVPNPSSSRLAVVESYRNKLNELFEEAPSTISLAGYLAGLYAAALVRDSGNSASRDSLLAQVSRRAPQDLGGWRAEFKGDRRASRFVTHTLLGADGKLIG